jgi:hypothetical protein
MKVCFKCSRSLPLSEFYRHPKMGDGHLGKCKECTKRDVKERYAITRPARAEYERERAMRPERRAQARERNKKRKYTAPQKYVANYALSNAIRDGKLLRAECCQDCGSDDRVQGHHPDYSKPLEVEWLCYDCHCHRHGKQAIV